MGKALDFFKKKHPLELDDATNLALREIAGWPYETHTLNGFKSRHHSLVIHRDPMGRVIGSVEHFDEDEYDQYSDTWGK